jgi:hypothetical protein
MRRSAAWVTRACAIVLIVTPVAAAGQSLAEVARKEQERRKTIKGPTKVYTNDDLGKAPAPPAPTPSTAAAPRAAGAAAPAKPVPPPAQPTADEVVKDENYWRQRITTARTDLDRNRMFLDALQSQVNALTTDYVNRDDPAQRAVVGNDRQRVLAEMERVRGEIQRLTAEITAIEEEARRAGVPPGWLR